MCDVCNSESGAPDVGVASLDCGPMSVMWCRKCLDVNAIPPYSADYLFVFVAGGKLDELHEAVKNYKIWQDGHYITFEDYVKKITPEEVTRQLDEYEVMCNRPFDDIF